MASHRFFTVGAKCSAVEQFVFGKVKYMFLSKRKKLMKHGSVE